MLPVPVGGDGARSQEGGAINGSERPPGKDRIDYFGRQKSKADNAGHIGSADILPPGEPGDIALACGELRPPALCLE